MAKSKRPTPTAPSPAASTVPAGTGQNIYVSRKRRFACMMYDGCLVFGIAVFFGVIFAALSRTAWPMPRTTQWIFQAYMFVTIGLYFVHCWSKTGQTLGMTTWRYKIVDIHGQLPTRLRALGRYAASVALLTVGMGILLYLFMWMDAHAIADKGAARHLRNYIGWPLAIFGANWLWSFIDRERLFLLDRLTGTRMAHQDFIRK